jgi:micrococcal nuclease
MTKIDKTIINNTEKINKRLRTHIGYRKYSSKPKLSISLILIILLAFLIVFYLGYQNGSSTDKISAKVIDVADGDTIRVKYDDGQMATIRLLGIDTPETHHPTKPVGCYGPQASEFTTKNLLNKDIYLEYDIEKYDQYGRTLAFVYLGSQRFNDVLVKNGYAQTLTIAPNKKYSFNLLKLELEAKRNKVGMWESCDL